MPAYAFYPQGTALVVVEAMCEDDAAALAHAQSVAAAHPEAREVSVWCDARYVGRHQSASAAQPPVAEAPTGAAATRKASRGKARRSTSANKSPPAR
ncbi:hypothetical protein [Phenylobacterium sp.]|jgi:hypothetical protein|uniref:hypothetical protein n=1 Tax=Phenylobacterium sp. TaxID=1871053 RepID=UPI002F92D3FF